jgi:ParB-like chromosome segregation protein Spo0J
MPKNFEKPKPPAPTMWDEVLEAFVCGDSQEAAKLLRGLEAVGTAELALVADLLSNEPALAKLFPFRLELIKRGSGRPTDYIKKLAEDASVARAVERALAPYGTLEDPHGQLEAAVETVRQQSKNKLSRAKIFRALAAYKKVKESKSQ